MPIVMTGIDHSQASLDVRSRFSFTAGQTEQLYNLTMQQPNVDGCVLISTCNRMELWLSSSKDEDFDLVKYICDFAGADEHQYRDYFSNRKDLDAIGHLFRLTAGLESRILGEDQIITQVEQSLSYARSLNASDAILEVLFRQAVTAGKRAKTEAVLSIADHSVIHTALYRLKDQGFCAEGKRCLVIGNGMMGRQAAQTLRENGADVCVTVRKYHHKAVEVPEGCRQMDYADRYAVIPECDLVVSATTSPHYTIEYAQMAKIKPEKPLFLLDLAVPRDMEPSVSELDGIFLYDIDSFHIDLQSDQLKENLQKIEKILQEEKEVFLDWYEGRDFAHQILLLKKAAGSGVLARMTPCLRQIPLDQEEKEKLKLEVSGAAERMMNHLLFSLRNQVKEETFREVIIAMKQIMK